MTKKVQRAGYHAKLGWDFIHAMSSAVPNLIGPNNKKQTSKQKQLNTLPNN